MQATISGVVSGIQPGTDIITLIEIVWKQAGETEIEAQAAGRGVNLTSPTDIASFQATGYALSSAELMENVTYTPAVRVTESRDGTGAYTGIWTSGAPFSTSISAPAAVTDLVATAASASVQLTWTAGVGATDYDILWGTVNPPVTVISDIGNVTEYTKTGLTDGTPYYFIVRSKNGFGTFDSGVVNATPNNIILGDDFESYAITASPTGNPPADMISAGWTSIATAGVVAVVDGTTVGTTGKVLEVTDNNSTGGCGVSKAFTASAVTSVKIKARPHATNVACSAIYVMSGPTTAAFGLFFGDNGAFSTSSGSNIALPTPTTYVADTWYDIELLPNFVNHTIEIKINGVSKGTVAFLNSASTVYAIQLTNTTKIGSQNGTVHYNDLLII